MLADLGMSKIMTISSTYDHRIIQGAESGLFLKRVHELLMGEDDFYEDVFRSVGVPYESVQWRRDVNPVDREASMLDKQMQVQQLVNMHRVRGHLIADLDPLSSEEPHLHAELDPATYGLTIWDLDREFFTGGIGGRTRMKLDDMLHVLRDAYCRTIGIEYMHIQEPAEKRWIQEHVEGVSVEVSVDEKHHILERLNAAEALEKFLGTKYLGQKRFGLDGAESTIPLLDAVLSEAADAHMHSAVLGMAHRGRLNVLVNIVGQELRAALQRVRGQHRPRFDPGLGRRQVPPRPDREVREPAGQRHQRRARRQPLAPRSRRPRRGRDGPGQDGPDRAAGQLPGAPGADPRRRRVRRPGRGGRDAQPAPTSRATGSAARST